MPVFTTKHVLDNNSPIIYVCHDAAGDWQFLGKEDNLGEADGRIVSLAELIDKRPYVEDILWIAQGMQAWFSLETNGWTTGFLVNENR